MLFMIKVIKLIAFIIFDHNYHLLPERIICFLWLKACFSSRVSRNLEQNPNELSFNDMIFNKFYMIP